MSYFFKQKSSPQQQQQPTYTALPTQTSAYGKAIAIVFGRIRIAANLLWYGGFKAVKHETTTNVGGSKGGPHGITTVTYTYQVNIIFGLCEGPIHSVFRVWKMSSTTDLSHESMELIVGSVGQAPWSFLSSNVPASAYPYSGIAYTAAGPLNLGDSANLDNYNFEVDGLRFGQAANNQDATSAGVISDLLTSQQFGVGLPSNVIGTITTVTETFTVPGSPYQITVAQASTFLKAVDVVIGGVALTCVAGVTSTGSLAANTYFVANGLYHFAAAQSGSSVDITYAYLANWTDYINYCQSAGLWVSLALDSSQQAASIINDLVMFTNSELVWTGGVLHIVPRGTVALSANGASYTPPSSPLFDINDDDFMPIAGGSGSGSSSDPVVVHRTRVADQDNQVKIEFLDRANNYAPAIVEASDEALAVQFGKRFSGTKTAHFFCDIGAAAISAQALLQKEYVRNTYAFSLDQRWIILDPMDLVTITDSHLGLDRQWVRIIEMTENDDGTIDFVAEEYLAGTGNPALYNINQGTGHIPDFNADPGDINKPVIFEAPIEIAATQLEIWAAISGASENWGGCDVFVSSDDATYTFVGAQTGGSRMGTLLSDFPTGTDPDTTSVLEVDLSESFGQLGSGSRHDAEVGNTLCYVDGELISYEIAELIGPYEYSLETYMRRGLGNTDIVAHPAGSQFARLDDTAIAKVPYAPSQINQTIYLKFVSFNIYGSGEQSISDVQAYTHKIIGPRPPGLVQNFKAQQTQGNTSVIFTWTDLDDFALKGYDILYGPVSGSVDNALELTIATRATEMTNASVPPGKWIFYIRGHDIVNQLGPAATFQLDVVDSTGVLLQDVNAPDWTGTGPGGSTTSAFTSFLITSATGTNWQVPNGVTTVNVTAIGSGGAGSFGPFGAMGSGGGGGAYATGVVNVTNKPTATIQIAHGLPTIFQGATSVQADCGKDATATVAGIGGTIASSIGDTVYVGGNGALAVSGQGGGGGGAAGTHGAGRNASGGAGGTGDNLFGGAGGAAINPNLVNSPNEFDNTNLWELIGGTIGTGLGPVTLSLNAGENFFTTKAQVVPASNTTYTISVECSGSTTFRFTGNNGSGNLIGPSADTTPTGGRVSWTVTTGVIGNTTVPNFGIMNNVAGGALSLTIANFKVEAGSTMTWNANPGGTPPLIAGAVSGAAAEAGAIVASTTNNNLITQCSIYNTAPWHLLSAATSILSATVADPTGDNTVPAPPPPPPAGSGSAILIGDYYDGSAPTLSSILGRPIDGVIGYTHDPSGSSTGSFFQWTCGTGGTHPCNLQFCDAATLVTGFGTATTAANGTLNSNYVNVAQRFNASANMIAAVRINVEGNTGFIWGLNGSQFSGNKTLWLQAYRQLALAFRNNAPTLLLGPNWNHTNGNADELYPGDDVSDFVSFDWYQNNYIGTAPNRDGPSSWNTELNAYPGFNWIDSFRKSGYTSSRLTSSAGLGIGLGFNNTRSKALYIAFPEWGVGNAAGGDTAGAYMIQQFSAWMTSPSRDNSVAFHCYWETTDSRSGYIGGLNLYPQSKAAFITAFANQAPYNGTWVASRGNTGVVTGNSGNK